MVCPSCCESCSNTTRGMMSVLLPAAKGTTARSGLVGHCWAWTFAPAKTTANAAISSEHMVFMTSSQVSTTGLSNVPSFVQYIVALDFMIVWHKVAHMDFRHLRTIVSVAEQGTVLKASARLGDAQPALS